MASHSSGIPISAALKDQFVEASRSGNNRLLKVLIQNEEMTPVASKPPSAAAWEDDLDMISPLLDPQEACYILFRMDEKSDSGHKWILYCYVPDTCKVRDKMLYAASRAPLKMALGSGFFSHDIFGTVKSDFTSSGFKSYLKMQKSAAPLTDSEIAQRLEIAASSAEASSMRASSPTMVHGVSFEADAAASAAVTLLVGSQSGDNYVQLSIDEARERIVLSSSELIAGADALADKIPLDRPAFSFYRYDHDFEGDAVHSVVYVYSCPDGSGRTKSAPVKARMLFSSCKGGVEALAAGRVALRLEINDGAEITAAGLMHKLHPPPPEKKEAFAKPKPAGKGPKRLIR
jgi:twinfilin-like protein